MVEPPNITSMNKTEFLRNPLSFYYRDREGMRDEWIAQAWEQDENFKEQVSYEFQREVSKFGNLNLLQNDLELLARALPMHRVIELYVRLRSRGERDESEFRPNFAVIYDELISEFLPPSDD